MSKARLLTAVFMAIALGHGSPGMANEPVDLSDVGDVYMENTGAAEAQQAFQHGLAQMHNFEYDFSAADFQEAQRIDPDFALAYWGEAMTHTHPIWMQQDLEAARTSLNKFAPTPAARQTKAPTEFARDLFTAADILYGEGVKEERDDLYLEHMGKLFAKYPGNVEIASFYALAIMGSAHEGREFGLYMRSAAITQNFIHKYPRHPGVAHYLIHATDDPVHAPLGLVAANAYGDIAPNAGHPQHMTTHIFLALGDWDGVVRANVRATEITNAERSKRGKGPSGCGHYTSWLMYGYLQQGKRDEAHEIMSLCHQNVTESDANYTRYYYAWQRSLYLLNSGEWTGDVAQMSVDFKDNNGARFENQIMDGWVAVMNGDHADASAALETARETLVLVNHEWDEEGVPVDQPSRNEPVVQTMQLEAKIILASGEDDVALNKLREAVAIEMELPFGFGPPSPAKPSLELLGETLVALGRLEEAQEVLRKALSRTPNKARSVAALEAATSGSGPE